VQGLGEGVWVGAEAAVVTGEGHGRDSQLLGERDRGAVGELPPGALADAHGDPGRARTQRGDIGDVGGERPEPMRQEVVQSSGPDPRTS
jgi:hypothetical protein